MEPNWPQPSTPLCVCVCVCELKMIRMVSPRISRGQRSVAGVKGGFRRINNLWLGRGRSKRFSFHWTPYPPVSYWVIHHSVFSSVTRRLRQGEWAASDAHRQRGRAKWITWSFWITKHTSDYLVIAFLSSYFKYVLKYLHSIGIKGLGCILKSWSFSVH